MFISSFPIEIRWPKSWVRYVCLACALVAALVAGGIARAYLARRSPPPALRFDTKGWEYRQIVPAMSGDGQARRLERYRLRVDVARSSDTKVLTAEAAENAENGRKQGNGRTTTGERDSKGDRSSPSSAFSATSAVKDLHSSPGSEFRILLERRDESDFVCLRWLDGELALLKFAGGGRARFLGRTSYVFPRLVRDAATASFHIDRSPGLWAVSSLGRELITAGDPGASARDAEAKAKAPDFAWGATPGWSLAARAFQPIEPIHFEDEFAREDFNGNGSYEIVSGAWHLDAAKDVGRSVNTFRLRGASAKTPDGRAEPAVAVLGSPFWRGYRVEASIRFSSTGSGGLVFAAELAEKPRKKDPPAQEPASPDARPSRFGILRWRLPGPPGDAKGARAAPVRPLEIVEAERKASGAAGTGGVWNEHVIFSLPWTPRRDQWYRVAVSLFAEFGELEVNGRRQTFPLPSRLRAGACGLYSDSSEGVLFDDVRVASHGGFLFRADGAVAPWDGSSGERMDLYRLPAGPAWLRLRLGKGTPAVRLSWGERPGGMVSLVLDRERLRGQIVRTRPANPGAAPVHVAEFNLGRPPDGPPASARPRQGSTGAPDEFTVEIGRGECSVLRGRTVLARASLRSARDGPVYLEAHAAGGPRLPHLAGGPLSPRRALRRKSKAFAKVDITMRNGEKLPEHKWIQFLGWLEGRGTWERGKVGQDEGAAKTGGADSFLRCRTLLWGTVEASARPDLPRKPGRSVMLALVPDGHDLAPIGVGARCEPGGEHVLVDIRGRRIAGIPKRDEQKVHLALRRSGDFVEASADGKLVHRSPLRSDAPVRVEARGGVSPDDVTIRASSVGESLFESAPVEWVRWRGRWDVTTKWQCDPRWTFLGLWSDRIQVKSEAAGIFTRASYAGDQDLQFYFAFKDVLGGAGDRRYVRRDVNFAFACAGEDLASGYCLLVGGFDNRGTQLLRRGKVVHENKGFRLPAFAGSSSDIHWKWFRMSILKRGGAIRAALNGKEILSWRDPAPLDGGHVGVWTIGNGIILGRTRFSAARRGSDMAGFRERAPRAPAAAGWLALDADHPVTVRPVAEWAPRGGEGRAETRPAGEGRSRRAHAVRVTSGAGGGHFAVGRARDGKPGSPSGDAKAFAFLARPGVRVSAYAVKTSSLAPGRPVASGGPPRKIAPSKGVLPADGTRHVFPIGGAVKSDETLVFGSWEPKDYVVAGIGANAAGASYEVGVFDSVEEARAFALMMSVPPNPRAGRSARRRAGPVLRLDPGARAGDGGQAAGRTVGPPPAWEPAEWANPVAVSEWKGSASPMRSLLLLKLPGGTRDKAAIRAKVRFDLAPRGSLRVDVHNTTSREIPVAFAVFASDDRVYSESRTRPAVPGWNHLEWSLSASTYKTAESGWKHRAGLARREDVREIVLLFYDKKSASLAIEKIEVDVRPGRQVAAAAPDRAALPTR